MAEKSLVIRLNESIALYRCPNKKADGYAVYTNTVPSGAFRGYGITQTSFGVECAMDELARKLGMDPVELRRKNMIRPGDTVLSIWNGPSDIVIGSYGLEECLDSDGTRPGERARQSQKRGRRMAGGEGDRDQHARLRAAHRTSFRSPDRSSGRRPIPPGYWVR